MEYNVYCDESCHLQSNNSKYMLIGAVYCPKSKVKKVNEYENTISNLEEDNYSLRIKVTHLKKKFKKMLKFLYDKLFGCGKKDSIYNQVVLIFIIITF